MNKPSDVCWPMRTNSTLFTWTVVKSFKNYKETVERLGIFLKWKVYSAFQFHNTATVILFVLDARDFTRCAIIRYAGVLLFDREDYNMFLLLRSPV